MRTVRTIAALREALAGPRRAGETIGLVPTMGALHDGHAELLRRARAETDLVVMSLFVNPAQFDEAADLAAYPRTEAADAAIAEAAGVDVLFAPPAEEVYPDGFATTVKVAGPALGLEGERRAGLHGDAVEVDDAGPALRGVAADVRAGQPQVLTQELDQECSGVDIGGDGFSVHRHRNGWHGIPLLTNPGLTARFPTPDCFPAFKTARN